MADTNFTDYSTVVPAAWLNDINDHVYNNTPISPATTVHPASVIANTPAGNISSTNVQAALNELDTEKAALSGAAFTGNVSTTGTVTVTGGSVIFPAVQVPNANVNALDDYEEGTWTPVVTASSGTITSYTAGTCLYTKIGRVVNIVVNVTITNNGTGSGVIQIAGLPFTATALTVGTGREAAATGNMLSIQVNNGATTLLVYTYNNTYPGGTGYTISGHITYTTST